MIFPGYAQGQRCVDMLGHALSSLVENLDGLQRGVKAEHPLWSEHRMLVKRFSIMLGGSPRESHEDSSTVECLLNDIEHAAGRIPR